MTLCSILGVQPSKDAVAFELWRIVDGQRSVAVEVVGIVGLVDSGDAAPAPVASVLRGSNVKANSMARPSRSSTLGADGWPTAPQATAHRSVGQELLPHRAVACGEFEKLQIVWISYYSYFT